MTNLLCTIDSKPVPEERALEICLSKFLFARNRGPMFTVHSNGCWLWIGSVSSTGYGNFNRRNKVFNAHRESYIAVFGKVPEGMWLDHLCRNRTCINPFHLEAVKPAVNSRRGLRAKLTQDIADKIRNEYLAGGVTMRALAAKYGIACSGVNGIVQGRAWNI